MINYIEISSEDYHNLKDKSGHYCIKTSIGQIGYFKNYQYHREDGAAFICTTGDKGYYLNGKYHGGQYNYTDEYWAKYCKLKAFQ